jgi:hypothetical protein
MRRSLLFHKAGCAGPYTALPKENGAPDNQLNSWVDEKFHQALALIESVHLFGRHHHVPISFLDRRRDRPQEPDSLRRMEVSNLSRPQHVPRWSH